MNCLPHDNSNLIRFLKAGTDNFLKKKVTAKGWQ